METECTKSEIKKHCWHTGSGLDTCSVTGTGGYTRTNFMCCWCGETKVEEHTWEHDNTPHGPHKYIPYMPVQIPYYQFKDTWTLPVETGTAGQWPFGQTKFINAGPPEVCAIEEFFKANPNATSCNIVCFCFRHAAHCSY